MSKRYVIVGAGAVGASLAAGFFDAGIATVLVSRGTTYDVIARDGLHFRHAGNQRVLPVPVITVEEIAALEPNDVLVFSIKTQDAPATFAQWAKIPVVLADGTITSAGEHLSAVTLQNGLDAERVAHRYFRKVISGPTLISAEHTTTGHVVVHNAPKIGQLILGPYPHERYAPEAGADTQEIVADLQRANWLAQYVEDPRRWKAWKLLLAVTFAVHVFRGEPSAINFVRESAKEEAQRILSASGYSFADPSNELTYDPSQAAIDPRSDYQPAHLSIWQSLARGSGTEVDYLNGEIVLLARINGLHAPVNAAIQHLVSSAAHRGEQPELREITELIDLIDRNQQSSYTLGATK